MRTYLQALKELKQKNRASTFQVSSYSVDGGEFRRHALNHMKDNPFKYLALFNLIETLKRTHTPTVIDLSGHFEARVKEDLHLFVTQRTENPMAVSYVPYQSGEVRMDYIKRLEEGRIYSVTSENNKAYKDDVLIIRNDKTGSFHYHNKVTNQTRSIVFETYQASRGPSARSIGRLNALEENIMVHAAANLDKLSPEYVQAVQDNFTDLSFVSEELEKKVIQRLEEDCNAIGKIQIKQEIDALTNAIQNENQRVEEYNSRIRDVLDNLEDLKQKMIETLQLEQEDFSQLKEFFRLPEVLSVEVNGSGKIELTVITDLKVEEDLAKPKLLSGIGVSNVNHFVQGILDNEIAIRFLGVFEIDLKTGNAGMLREQSKQALTMVNFPDVTLNPHHGSYSCLGSYAELIRTAGHSKQWIAQALYVISATANLNILDGPVMRHFMNALDMGTQYDRDFRVFHNPTQKHITFNDYVRMVRERERK